MSKLPPGQNPYALLEAADRAAKAGDPELYQSLLEQSQKLMQDYKATGIPMPDGTVVPFPGSQESLARGERLKTLATGEATQVNEYNKGISEAQSTFNSRGIVVDGLRQALSTAETGKFAELKADLVNAAASLGLANSEQIAEAEDIQIAMKYFAQGILDSGMKDSIGPQISNADLILVAKGQGTVENLPVANRKIVGAMYGKLMYDRAKNAAFDNFVAERGGLARPASSGAIDGVNREVRASGVGACAGCTANGGGGYCVGAIATAKDHRAASDYGAASVQGLA